MSALHQQVDVVRINFEAARAGRHCFLVLPDGGVRLRELQDQFDIVGMFRQGFLCRRDSAFVVGERMKFAAERGAELESTVLSEETRRQGKYYNCAVVHKCPGIISLVARLGGERNTAQL